MLLVVLDQATGDAAVVQTLRFEELRSRLRDTSLDLASGPWPKPYVDAPLSAACA